uniref:ENT domain-containing protein n=1 Tax=Opuntia streptacantha TaxID=393608 RepID=A0A7C8Z8K1_OPUST
MEYHPSDSSGTDDDLPPPHQNRFSRTAHVGNGRSAVARSVPYSRLHNDMETQIHLIEQEAYCSILRAFKAQSDAITWEKESLITELRKELRVSDEEHRELLSKVNNDDMIRRIREWRKANGLQPGALSSSKPVHESMPSPTVSASRKKQKASQSVASLPVTAPSPGLLPSMQPSSSSLKQGLPQGGRTKKTKSPMQYPSVAPPGRPQVSNRSTSGAVVSNQPAEAANLDPLIGQKVWTRWPEDNNFYQALITDFKEGQHALVYEMNTPNEAWEWVDLKEISPKDIKWESQGPGSTQGGGHAGQGRGFKKSSVRAVAVASAGRGRGALKGPSKKGLPLPQNGIRRKASGSIELLHTDTLIKEVEKIFRANHPDPAEVEKAKKVLKEHEQALVEAIARLQEASDGESDEGGPFTQGQSMDRDQAWRKRMYDQIEREGPGTEVPEGDKGRLASEKL